LPYHLSYASLIKSGRKKKNIYSQICLCLFLFITLLLQLLAPMIDMGLTYRNPCTLRKSRLTKNRKQINRILKIGLKAVLLLTVIVAVIFWGCKKREMAATPKPDENLLRTIASDSDFRPIAYMLNKDYINLRMSLHDSNDVEGRANELIRAIDYIAAYGYKLQQKYKLTNTIPMLINAAKIYDEKVDPDLSAMMKAALNRKLTVLSKPETKPREVVLMTCPGGFVFNDSAQVCDWPWNCPDPDSASAFFWHIDFPEGFVRYRVGEIPIELDPVTVTAYCYDTYDKDFDMLSLMCPEGYAAVFDSPFSTDRRATMKSEPFWDDCQRNQKAYMDEIYWAQLEYDMAQNQPPPPPDPPSPPSGNGGSGGGTGGGGGSDGSGGDSGSSGGGCAEAQATKATTLSKNSKYTSAKNTIQNANQSIEHAIAFGKDASGNVTISAMKDGGSNNGTIPSIAGYFADIHIHTNVSPPSSGDIYGLIDIIANSSNFETRYIVTSTGTVYALAVDNISWAKTFNTNYPRQPAIPPYEPMFPTDMVNEINEMRSDGASEEMALAFILEKYHAGISLFRQSNDGSFKKLNTTESIGQYNQKTYTANNCL
jgi:uncharacterized membrane protein YgcG